MEKLTDSSTAKQPRMITGPTVTLVRVNEQMHADDDSKIIYTYDLYRFKNGEHDLVRNGILPQGAEWDDVLRTIEREPIIAHATEMVDRYEDDGDTVNAQLWRAYRKSVRDTALQPNYPQKVEWPVRPDEHVYIIMFDVGDLNQSVTTTAPSFAFVLPSYSEQGRTFLGWRVNGSAEVFPAGSTATATSEHPKIKCTAEWQT